MTVAEICGIAKRASGRLAAMTEAQKNEYLLAAAAALRSGADAVAEANAVDMALSEGKPSHFLDRLRLTPQRIEAMARGLEDVAALPDPVGEVIGETLRPNGLLISKIRVPLGVVGIIYEARPNVTADTIGLCIKSGNCVVLRGSSEALNSNRAIVSVIKSGLAARGLTTDFIQLIEDTGREGASELMRLRGVIDVLLPRGGAGLIKSVVENSTVPVIETGVGNCHIYVHESADLSKALEILLNAKLSRPSVCNAAESLLVDAAVAEKFIPVAVAELRKSGVVIKGCERTYALDPSCDLATAEDYAAEFLGPVISVKIVDNLDDAVRHIGQFGTGHSDAIVTEDSAAGERFLNAVDSAAVYLNASTRFTDGGEFGFGAELGISTQKLHARGPVGLKELTSYKYTVRGTGQIRE